MTRITETATSRALPNPIRTPYNSVSVPSRGPFWSGRGGGRSIIRSSSRQVRSLANTDKITVISGSLGTV